MALVTPTPLMANVLKYLHLFKSPSLRNWIKICAHMFLASTVESGKSNDSNEPGNSVCFDHALRPLPTGLHSTSMYLAMFAFVFVNIVRNGCY